MLPDVLFLSLTTPLNLDVWPARLGWGGGGGGGLASSEYSIGRERRDVW